MLPVLLAVLLAVCPCGPEYVGFVARFDRPTASLDRCFVFCENAALVHDHNANADRTYDAEIKPFHDLTEPERIAALHNNLKSPRARADGGGGGASVPLWVDPAVSGPAAPLGGSTAPIVVPLQSPPAERNWWLQNRVVDVRNQGDCGDCWAESAAAVLESAYAQQTGVLTKLSVQQIAECTPQEINRGCEGGWPADALRWVKAQGGVCSEADYPTTIGADGIDVPCNATKGAACKLPINLTDVVTIAQGDEGMLFAALTVDVVSVAIDASGRGFAAYKSGVYDGTFNRTQDCFPTALDHAVLAAGYGYQEDTKTPFYLVKNSWGDEQWGAMGGYILMKRGVNVCGIAQDATYVEF